MEFHEKLQHLRKQKGLTQEALAQQLFVSRAAVSKWESGRGYPNIDSLKALADCFSVTVDQLLSGEEVLTIARQDVWQRETRLRDRVFGLLDCSAALLLFLPFFGQVADGAVQAVSLLTLSALQPWLKGLSIAAVTAMVLTGLLTLALQDRSDTRWGRASCWLSFACSTAGVLLFILSRQPYAAVFFFVFLMIKAFFLVKKQ